MSRVPDILDCWCQSEQRERLLDFLKREYLVGDIDELRVLITKNPHNGFESIFLEFPLCLPAPIKVIPYPHDRSERWENFFGIVGFHMGSIAGMEKAPPKPLVYPDEEEIRLLLGKIMAVDPASLSLNYFNVPVFCSCCS
ncbi:MAG: hypothetical protein Q8P67_22670 [archaeon]|nr:hypothetical protein [archaeon]